MGEGTAVRRVTARAHDHRLATGVALAVAIAVAAWPVRTLRPPVAWDWDWLVALSYAAEHGLRFGEQIAFSYGPLGFLNSAHGPTLYYDSVLLLAWSFAAIVQVLLAGALLVALRRSFPMAVAVVLAAVVLALVPDRALALGFAVCALAVTRDEDAERDLVASATPIVLGVLAGVLLLGKLNQGIELVVLAVVTLVAVPSRRDALAFTAALLATAAAGWLASGQTPADLWPYVRYGAEVIAGYAAAMGLVDHAHRWTYVAALAIAVAALLAAWDAGRRASPRRRWGLLALCFAFAAFNFKEGFVRQDVVHLTFFFGDALVLFAVLPVRPSRRPVLVGAIAAIVVAFGAVAGMHELTRSGNVYANVKSVADQTRTLVSPARRAAVKAEVRANVAAAFGVGPELVEAIGKRPMMMWPHLFAEFAYAYDLNLRMLPTLEPYATYTPALDRLDEQMLASARAPTRILRATNEVVPGVDGRYATFEAPLATLAILCRYRDVAEQQPWHVLARTRNRCGPSRTLSRVDAAWGASVEVPAPKRPGALLLVRVQGTGASGLERLRALVLRPHERWIELDETRYRLVAATAADGLLLHVPADADYPPPYALAPNPLSIAVGRNGGEPGGHLEYTFVEMPIRPFPTGAGA